jgi:hypothetical protein
MLLHAIIIASTVAAHAAAADAKRRQDQGLPPLPEPPPAPPPTWKDRCADVAFWALVFSPAIAIGSMVGMALYVVIKIAFARQGLSFP